MRFPSTFTRLISVCLPALICCIDGRSVAQQQSLPADPTVELVPHYLLPLLHAAEVQDELELTPAQRKGLEALFRETDGPWFRARNLTPPETASKLVELEKQVHKWLEGNALEAQRKRLREIEIQAQQVRALLRSDVSLELDLQPDQTRQLVEMASQTNAVQLKLAQAMASGQEASKLEKELIESQRAEQAFVNSLTEAQKQKVPSLVGDAFDTAGLKRIYPLAPEIVGADKWINSSPVTMESLRGNVVLVHFYAFQCSNCQANFDVYRRWHEELTPKGVVVLGIQTPETVAERNAELVRKAAEDRELNFPILVDLESKNWEAWGNTMWPTVYVVDQNGYLRFWWPGELRWQGATGDKQIETLVDELLKEAATSGS